IKQGTADKFNAYMAYMQRGDLSGKFQGGVLFGGVLLDILLVIDGITAVGKVVAAMPGLLRTVAAQLTSLGLRAGRGADEAATAAKVLEAVKPKAPSATPELLRQQAPSKKDLPILNLQSDDAVVNASVDALAKTRGDRVLKLGELNLIQKGETLTIVAHGSPTELGGLSANEVAELLKANKLEPKKIELVACQTGRGCFYKDLSQAMNAQVSAPMFNVNVLEDIYGVPQVRDPITGTLRKPGELIVNAKPKSDGFVDRLVNSILGN
ncbi:Peptidase C80 family protein, partial [Andreprevotia lacus DSM 23236]